MTPAICERLAWDSDFFGLRIARVAGESLPADVVPRVKAYCAAERIDCVYFLADAADAAASAAAQAGGFRFVDVRVTLERSTKGLAKMEARDVRRFRLEDGPALRAIAAVSHRDSRFYADSHFPSAACDRLYETWIERSYSGWAQAVLVAEAGGGAAGYITCHVKEGGAGSIGLVAVAAEHRGKGLGRQLIEAALQYFRGEGVERVSVVTQGRNIESQRLYQRCGFLTAGVQVWYHYWSHSA
jgi:dTDP-4-amino-4,6-dideoxy-D-galactose acyltransferase